MKHSRRNGISAKAGRRDINIFDACNITLEPIIITALETGMRRNEILSIKRLTSGSRGVPAGSAAENAKDEFTGTGPGTLAFYKNYIQREKKFYRR